MSKENCCDLGKTGPDCEKECKYFKDDYCTHPDADKEDLEPGEQPLCGHLCC